jgi:hypothetical protein
MGGKNDAPEAPDYSELAKASKESAQYSYDLAKRQQDWAEKTYNENKGVSDLVIDKALGALDRQEQWASEDRARYQTIFQPLEEQLAQEAQDYASPERQEVEAGKAEADVAQQFQQARQTAQDRLESFGVDPSQTRSGALDLGTRVAEAAAQASAGNQARTQTENIGRALRGQAIDVGKGYPSQYQAAQTGSTSAGNQAASTGLATTASGANTMGTGGDWQGRGNTAIGTWGDIINKGFSNQLDSYKANQESSSGWGQLLGTLGGAALGNPAFFAEGGAIPDEGEAGLPIPPSASPSNGAIPDDVPAEIDGQTPAQLNAGEFVMPKDVVSWLGEKGMQQMILKARKEMANGNGERPAQPEVQGGPPIPPESVGAIPMPQGG